MATDPQYTCPATTSEDLGRIYTYIANYVRKHYNSLQKTDQEDVIQETTVLVLHGLDKFDPSRGSFDKFLAFHIRTAASKAYGKHVSLLGASAYVRKRAKEIQEDLDRGLSVDEVAEKRGIRKNTVLHYQNVTSGVMSLDSVNQDGQDMYEKLSLPQEQPQEQMLEEMDFSSFSEQEQFVLKTYLKYVGKKDWKQKTLEECAKWGLSKKQTMDAIKKVRK